MTGFGRASGTISQKEYTVEVKSLNGKQFDMSNKNLPLALRAYELDLRKLLSEKLHRGSLDCNIIIKQGGIAKPMVINTALAKFYYQGMKQIADEINIPEDNILSTLMRMPEVIAAKQETTLPEEWEALATIIENAAEALMEHRKDEGKSLEKDLTTRIENILSLLQKIEPLAQERTEKIKAKIQQLLNSYVEKENIDENRLEQEMIYYLERMDISEEKTRLQQHGAYFLSVVHNNDITKGKKLNFILQEAGREINTLGAKANHAGIQKIVIEMKDELEKAKEQVLNVL